MKLRALIEKEDSICGWWRIIHPFEYLRKAGVDAKVCWLDGNELPTESISGAIVILQRLLCDDNRFINNLRKLGPRAIVYELDDDTLSSDYLEYLNGCGRISPSSWQLVKGEIARQISTIQQCDAVTVSSTGLSKKVLPYLDRSKHVFIIKNLIDVAWYTAKLDALGQSKRIGLQLKKDNIITIGWSGGLRPEKDVAAMAQAWGRISNNYPNVMFVVGGFQHNVIYENVPLERIYRIPFQPLDTWPTVNQVDIGCCPLDDNGFNWCKSPIKAFEFGLSGAAVVASDVVYSEVINHQRNGFVVNDNNSVDDWEFYLSTLVEDESKRHAFRDQWQEEIRKEHSLERRVQNWFYAYEDILRLQNENKSTSR